MRSTSSLSKKSRTAVGRAANTKPLLVEAEAVLDETSVAHAHAVCFVATRVVLDSRGHETAIDEGAGRDVVDRGLDDSDSRIG